ncbi:2OG-Fe(II) oxygenase [Altererythrobacter sp. RZ02]|uniref:2OG-Fe(II) oxygenase n=1 Tax=Pontixanthobacter rizhaonensis TaxID=2730337 RepID=A0A848QBU0_9SPHN|nr:2OG-Fe(II) oxygenase [Pontixanthobacter rizhaonensis]NMW31011.1 2OG-Fe(II) oxygenase [Pontixanthobacter rizhaonensis]
MAKTATIPDRDALKRVGAAVRARLEDDPKAYKIPTEEAEIYAIGGFLTAPECTRLVTMIDVVAKPSELYDQAYSTGFRTSFSGNLDPHDPFVAGISRRIDDFLGIKAECGEAIQGQRYLPGQEFKAHNDWFYTDQEYWKMERKNGGQRSWTAMIFLNAVEKGGSTHFTTLQMNIAPQPGVLLAWNNADPSGVPNEKTLHAGTPVEEGTKYIITKWYRTRKWG